MNKGAPAKVSKKALAHFCISMDAYRDGLKRLEAAGLITVARLPGQSPFVRVVRPAQPQ
jgi:DNA-binding FadR family transcriptional regulator